MAERIPSVLMRGGTSRGLFFHERDLPRDEKLRERVILAAYGSPDPFRRQTDGVGGGTSQTSKVAIIRPAEREGYDVVYRFGQVAIDRPEVDFRGNCGNLSAAVGPFAVDEGLIPAAEPVTRVRIHQENTNTLIVAEVPVREGRFLEAGDFTIDGVPFPGSRIRLHFVRPEGAVTRRLFPTGSRQDRFTLPGGKTVAVTCLDAANPFVFVRADALGLAGTEIEAFDGPGLRETLEALRRQAAVAMGIAPSAAEAARLNQAVPKIAVVGPPADYRAVNGHEVEAGEITLVARMMSMGALHRAYAVSGAIATAGAARIPGTVVSEIARLSAAEPARVVIGHPSGRIEAEAKIAEQEGGIVYEEGIVGRTARRLMEGFVLVPERILTEGRP